MDGVQIRFLAEHDDPAFASRDGGRGGRFLVTSRHFADDLPGVHHLVRADRFVEKDFGFVAHQQIKRRIAPSRGDQLFAAGDDAFGVFGQDAPEGCTEYPIEQGK